MATALITHLDCLRHETPPGHPERADRLRAVLAALDGPTFHALRRIHAEEVDEALAAKAHAPEMIDAVKAATPGPGGAAALDADTFLSPGSWRAARLAAGAVVQAVDLVMEGAARAAFCAVRPPGHHAESGRAMGFCLINNAAVGALHALDAHGLDRVAIVDFDVHHGNGTQEIFQQDPRVLYVSTHQSPLFPGTGRESETGAGNIVNVEMAAHSGSATFRAAVERAISPAIERHAPQLLIISAGFDAHAADPLAQISASTDDFFWATERLCDLAERFCPGRVVSTLEGGYDLDALSKSAAAHVSALMAFDARGAAGGGD